MVAFLYVVPGLGAFLCLPDGGCRFTELPAMLVHDVCGPTVAVTDPKADGNWLRLWSPESERFEDSPLYEFGAKFYGCECVTEDVWLVLLADGFVYRLRVGAPGVERITNTAVGAYSIGRLNSEVFWISDYLLADASHHYSFVLPPPGEETTPVLTPEPPDRFISYPDGFGTVIHDGHYTVREKGVQVLSVPRHTRNESYIPYGDDLVVFCPAGPGRVRLEAHSLAGQGVRTQEFYHERLAADAAWPNSIDVYALEPPAGGRTKVAQKS